MPQMPLVNVQSDPQNLLAHWDPPKDFPHVFAIVIVPKAFHLKMPKHLKHTKEERKFKERDSKIKTKKQFENNTWFHLHGLWKSDKNGTWVDIHFGQTCSPTSDLFVPILTNEFCSMKPKLEIVRFLLKMENKKGTNCAEIHCEKWWEQQTIVTVKWKHKQTP